MDRNDGYSLITDIGSTTTKGLLLTGSGSNLSFVEQFDTPTTVEKPEEDVRVGLVRLVGHFEERIGQKLLDDKGILTIPYLTTSSAGGGLQILVFGLSSVETGTIAEMTAYGAGGIVLKTFTIDDEISPVQKMHLMGELHPDMILMAGGLDGGAIAPVVELAEILSLAKPSPKFRVGEKIPLVFCGNSDARSFVKNLLTANFDVHIVPNVRPDMETLNTEPAKAQIHELFMGNVMERAPGYSELKKEVKSDIIPTPAGVEKTLSALASKIGKNIAMVDIGGATTDIFTSIKGQNHRTVAANIGMSYSLSNTLVEAGIDNVMSHLDSLGEREVRDYIANKTLNPTHVPCSESQKIVEFACAAEGMKIAWDMHREMNFKVARIGFLDRRHKLLPNSNRWEEVLRLNKRDEKFQLSDISLLIGAGGVISHSPPEIALLILVDAFMPSGVTELAIDRNFKSPHMGILSIVAPGEALRLFENECLEFLGHVVAPMGKIREGKKAVTVENRANGVAISVDGGDVKTIPGGGDFRIECFDKLRLENDVTYFELKTDKPLIIDCRGRGIYFSGGKLARFECAEKRITPIELSKNPLEIGEYEIVRRLPYAGDILVHIGDRIEPDDVVGENRFGPPRLYILDLNRLIGYEKPLTEAQVADGLLVAEGESVKVAQRVFKSNLGILGSKSYFSSPVRGMVSKIEASGLIIMREIQDYDGKPHRVHVAKEMNIKSKHLPGYLKFRVGDFVEKGQIIASDLKSGVLVKSPSTGIIVNIDRENGVVTVQHNIEPTILRAFARGVVTDVKAGHEVRIEIQATKIYGKIGFGSECSGELIFISDFSRLDGDCKGKIVVSPEPIDKDFLRRCAEIGIAGLIAPSISNSDWIEFYGKELGVALTGDEVIPFPVIFTAGFGNYSMSDEYRALLEKRNGALASISGRTQIRAGVIRPVALIYED